MKDANAVASATTLQKLNYDKILQKLSLECSSTLGKDLALTLFPRNDKRYIRIAQEQTSEAVYLRRVDPEIPLGGIVDIYDLLNHLKIGGQLEGPDFNRVLDTLYATRNLKHFISHKHEEDNLPELKELAESLKVFDVLEKDIKKKIDVDGSVRDGASEKLRSLRKKISEGKRDIRNQMDRFLRNEENQPYLQENIITLRNDRFVLAVKQEYRQRIPGIIHDQSTSGATLYIEPMSVVAKNNQVHQFELDEEAEVKRILQELSTLLRPYVHDLRINLNILSELDLIFAKARLAEKMNAISPDLESEVGFYFRAARHPLLDAEKVVPISVGLDSKRRCLVITGPNTGGKTVTLKTVGLLVLMYQTGLHLPVETDSRIGIFEYVFADIGDEQSIEQSLSTFSAHLTNITKILDKLNDRSLVLYDELGAGTDPSEGAALAMAILDYSIDIGARVIATTHYSALKTYAFNKNFAENASVEFDIQSLQPTYRLLIGVPGSSNAFDISARIGLDAHVIKLARQLAEEQVTESQKLMKELEDQKIISASLELELQEKLISLKEKEQELDAKLSTIESSSESIINNAKQKAADILSAARIEADSATKELKKLRKQSACDAATQAKSIRDKLSSDAAILRSSRPKKETKNKINPDKLKIGDEVYLKAFHQNATVIELLDKNGTLQVQSGIMKISVPLSDIEILGKNHSKKERSYGRKLGGNEIRSFSPELDIRGAYVDEALPKIDKYLDDAFLTGLKEIQIIHGKGTGALRKGVRDALKHHVHVSDYRTGTLEEGGDGVTVVKLK